MFNRPMGRPTADCNPGTRLRIWVSWYAEHPAHEFVVMLCALHRSRIAQMSATAHAMAMCVRRGI